MESESRIRLSPPQEVTPCQSDIPIAQAHYWRSPFDDGLQPAVSVFMTQRAYVRCCAHAGKDLNNESGGALAGMWRVDSRSGHPFIVIEAALPARHTRQGSTFLTFTQDSLVALHDDLDDRYPGQELVGWYHTHPRMGIFLSGYDVWLHEHFFPNAWQVALVIEPHASTGGFFVRQSGGQLDPRRYFGFYELTQDGRPSVMRWGNLHLDPTPAPMEGA